MKLEEGIISPLQFFFLTTGMTLGVAIIAALTVPLTKHNNWLAIILAIVEGVIIISIFTLLTNKFPDKTLVEINNLIYGKYLGKIISIGYIIYFFLIIPLNLRYFSDFFISLIMPETPLLVFLLIIIIPIIYAVKEGLEVIARCSLLFLIPLLFEVLITPVLLLPKMDLGNFLPVLDIEISNFFKAGHILASILFGELIILMMISPFINKKEQIKRRIIWGIITSGIVILLAALRNTSVLGPTEIIYTYPSYQATRLIDIRDFITRLEVIVAGSFLFAMFLRVSITYYATVLATSQLLKLRSYLPLVIPIGIIAVTFSFFIFECYREQMNFGREIYPIISFPFQIGIPLLSLLINKLRNISEN